jgi:hypothetical protein
MIVGLTCAMVAVVAQSQISITEGGTPSYSMPISVPPGIAGMAPNVGLLYSGGGVNGPVGYGWSIQGISVITRCPNIKAIDGRVRGVDYSANDTLCLDGQRLIQTDANGVVTPVIFPQGNDSLGGTGLVHEYRTEKDTYARIRAYGMANNLAVNGPAYFKVWTKSGQIYEYGNNANSTANAAIAITGKTAISAWAVSRISDTLGNYMDFQYEQRDMPWGSGPTAGSPTPGHEWNLLEIRYTGTATQAPVNKVAFEYVDRTNTAGTAQDSSEAYHRGAKNVSIRRLNAVRSYINITGTPLKVKTTKLTYTPGTLTKRSLVTQIQECVGAAETQCLPPTVFNYSAGGGEAFTANPGFSSDPLATTALIDSMGMIGVAPLDFDGDGKTDLLAWSDSPAQNKLYRSNGDGTFSLTPSFNITSEKLFSSNGCYTSVIADFNGDGVSDFLRIVNVTTPTGVACALRTHLLFLSQRDGSFTQVSIPSVVSLDKIEAHEAQICSPGCTAWVRSSGNYFYVIDVNGDGILDIVTTTLPGYYVTSSNALPSDQTLCATVVCTRVFIGDANGAFTEVSTNVAHRSLYRKPSDDINGFSGIGDVNGDGLNDIFAANGNWQTRIDAATTGTMANFDLSISNVEVPCVRAIDFNGDGRDDCIQPQPASGGYGTPIPPTNHLLVSTGNGTSTVASFNLLWSPDQLTGTGLGYQVLDINGDGRGDILRWSDTPSSTVAYLSNGDGTFSASSSFNLNTPDKILRKSNGTVDFVVGDYLGIGVPQILRVMINPSASPATSNQLYTKAVSESADHLLSVVSSTGLKTDLIWVPLTNSSSGTLGVRYVSDRGTPNKATLPVVDVAFPMQVVATSISDSGVGTGRVTTEYSYAGLKAAYDGRGGKGFRETRRQMSGPNGQNLTVVTQYLQGHPYTGVASNTSTYLGTLNATSANAVSSSDYLYCEFSSTAIPTLGVPCAVPAGTKVQRPYLYQSIDNARELTPAGNDVLPTAFSTVTTKNTFNSDGDPTNILVTTSGAVLGTNQIVTKTTVNTYQPDDMSGDNWVLGRLATATQSSQSINILNSVTPSAGTATLATATQGIGSPPALTLTACGSTTPTIAPTAATMSCILSNTGGTSVSPISYASPLGTTASGPASCAANATCGAVTVTTATAAASYSGNLTATPNTGSAVSAVVSLVVITPPALSLSACTSTSPTTPTAAVMICTLSNTGQAAVSTITYAAIAGVTVSGPTGTCAANSTCGTVTVTSGTAAGTYSGTLTATPNAGSGASKAVTLVVNQPSTPAALALSACTNTSPTTSPTAATLRCTLSNTGQTAINSISYSAIASTSVSGPTGACAANATCGTVTVTSATSAGTYSGTLTATPNTGTAASTAVSLVVNPPPAGTFSTLTGATGTSGTGSGNGSYITIKNTGNATITGIGATCQISGAYISSGLVSSLAPNATMTVYSIHPMYIPACVYRFTGTNASNSPYVDTRY